MSPVFELMSQRSSAWAHHDVIIKMATESQVAITCFITLYLCSAGKERTIRKTRYRAKCPERVSKSRPTRIQGASSRKPIRALHGSWSGRPAYGQTGGRT